MPKEAKGLLIVSLCAALLPIGMVYFGDGLRDREGERDFSLQKVLDSGHIILSAVQPETIANRADIGELEEEDK